MRAGVARERIIHGRDLDCAKVNLMEVGVAPQPALMAEPNDVADQGCAMNT